MPLARFHLFGTSLGERVNQYYLTNTIGQPLETAAARSCLIFSGTLDHFPGLKILAAHCGGYYLPYAISRSSAAIPLSPRLPQQPRLCRQLCPLGLFAFRLFGHLGCHLFDH